jgi:hypothetical protein
VVWNLTTGQVTTYSDLTDGSLDAVSNDGTAIGEVAHGGISVPVIATGGQLRRLPAGTRDNLQVYMNAHDITADGHIIVGTSRTPVDTEGPYSEAGLLWHC